MNLWQKLFALSGWIVAAFVWVLDLPAKLDNFYEHRDAAWRHVVGESAEPKAYLGRWTNDIGLRPDENLITDGSPRFDNGDVQIDVSSAENGAFSGEIETKLMRSSDVAWSRVSINGSIGSMGGFDGEVWDVVGGRHHTIARFNLTPLPGKDFLAMVFTADEQYSKILPAKTVLWRTDAAMSQGQQGEGFAQFLKKAIREQKASN